MKVIIAGGGTGGHLFPAVALGEEIRRQCPAAEVLHVGTSAGMEAKWLPQSGLSYELFEVHGITGKDPISRLRALGEFFSALGRALALIRKRKPDLVVSAGGYASAPMAVSAIITRVPLVLMEQNTKPGLANRALWRFARKICVGFAETAACFDPSRVEVTGNPVRFTMMPHPVNGLKTPGQLQILVLGGSTGAHRLNLGVPNALRILGKDVIKLSVTHQTGEADVGLARAMYGDIGVAARVLPFIDDVARALDQAELVIARSGAMTVSEVALAARPAIFVPYPFHRDRQQELNARVIERLGGAIIIRDDERLAENLATAVRDLIADPARLVTMGRQAGQAAKGNAAKEITRICFAVSGLKRCAA